MVTDPNFGSTEELAGAAYEDMIQSSQKCLEYLGSPDLNVRLAAIRLCITNWGIGRGQRVLEACRTLAEPEVPEPWRLAAVGFLGYLLEGSKDRDFSRLVATIVADPRTSDDLRQEAYWALRWIQHGASGGDPEEFHKGIIHTAKRVLRKFPERFSESEVRSNLNYPQQWWDTADDIDWDFVRRFI